MDILIIGILLIFLIAILIAFFIGNKIGELKKQREWENQLDGIRSDAINRSRAVLGGQFSEQLAPYLPDFNYNPSDCKFIGKPVDFIVFNGLSNGELKDITFLEIKSGDSKINGNQKKVKDVVENGRIKWEEYRIPKDLTRKKD
ncbi:Endonuclease related to archaeal Holliday junction resolvase [uncultured archaeon]|nr:Endonuclease related to archaeal Holliday junction resolvase [uncultured archaeon]